MAEHQHTHIEIEGMRELLHLLIEKNRLEDAILEKLDRIERKVEHMSAEMDRLTASVEKQKTVDASIIALLNGIAKQLRDLIAAGSDPAALTALADSIDQNNQAVADAVTANTPAA